MHVDAQQATELLTKYTSELKMCCPLTRSIQPTSSLTFSAAITPSTPPIKVPTTPITVPCTMKIAMICRGVAPMVRRIAMSAPLSFTTMIRVAMMLNAATATIISNSRPIMVFSIFIALNRLPWAWVQSSAL
jgi:hypothetical protein